MINKIIPPKNVDIALLILRLFIGLRLCYGVIDNVISWEQMLEFAVFLEQNGFVVPLFSAVISVYSQLICSLMILFGYRIRIAGLIMVINFIVAIVFFHLKIGDTIEGMTAPFAMLVGALVFYVAGAGKYAMQKN